MGEDEEDEVDDEAEERQSGRRDGFTVSHMTRMYQVMNDAHFGAMRSRR